MVVPFGNVYVTAPVPDVVDPSVVKPPLMIVPFGNVCVTVPVPDVVDPSVVTLPLVVVPSGNVCEIVPVPDVVDPSEVPLTAPVAEFVPEETVVIPENKMESGFLLDPPLIESPRGVGVIESSKFGAGEEGCVSEFPLVLPLFAFAFPVILGHNPNASIKFRELFPQYR